MEEDIFHSGHHHQPHKGHSSGKTVIPSCCLIARGVNMESKSTRSLGATLRMTSWGRSRNMTARIRFST
eukprot:361231-Pelagomonas_calceolata.AAC.1